MAANARRLVMGFAVVSRRVVSTLCDSIGRGLSNVVVRNCSFAKNPNSTDATSPSIKVLLEPDVATLIKKSPYCKAHQLTSLISLVEKEELVETSYSGFQLGKCGGPVDASNVHYNGRSGRDRQLCRSRSFCRHIAIVGCQVSRTQRRSMMPHQTPAEVWSTRPCGLMLGRRPRNRHASMHVQRFLARHRRNRPIFQPSRAYKGARNKEFELRAMCWL